MYTVLSIFNNLVANAVEAIEDRGLIHIKLYKREQHVIFEVIDDGPGITQKYKKLVFKPGLLQSMIKQEHRPQVLDFLT